MTFTLRAKMMIHHKCEVITSQYLEATGLGDEISEIELELNAKPAIFSDLERAGLKIGAGSQEGVEVSILALSALGATLLLEYYPLGEEQSPFLFNGSVIIPGHQIIAINRLARDVAGLAQASVMAKAKKQVEASKEGRAE